MSTFEIREENPTGKIPIDIPFLVLGFLIMAWGWAEYRYPPTEEFYERFVPKMIHVSLIVWSFLCVFFDLRGYNHLIIFRRTIRWGMILSVILFTFPFFSYNSDLELWKFLKAHFRAGFLLTEWFIVMYFCVIHTQVNPRAYHTFQYFVPAIVLCFFVAAMAHSNLNIESKRSEVNQNGIYAGYYLVCLYPFIWDLRNKILKIFLTGLVIYGTIYSMKRGAMLCLMASLSISFLVYYLFFATGKRRIPYFYAFIVLVGLTTIFLFYSVSQRQDTFNKRMETLSTGSGRIGIYTDALYHFRNYHLFEKAFGSRSEKLCTHNDILFMLVNYGIVGMVVICCYILQTFRLGFDFIIRRHPFLPACLTAIFTGFIIQMVSYGVEGHTFVLCCIYIGIMQGLIFEENNRLDEMGYEMIEEFDEVEGDWEPEDETDEGIPREEMSGMVEEGGVQPPFFDGYEEVIEETEWIDEEDDEADEEDGGDNRIKEDENRFSDK